MEADAPADEVFLDDLFERISSALADGGELDIEGWTSARPHLREEAEELVALARQIAPGRSAPARELAGYQILRQLGKGAMGTVYLARRATLGGRPIALKVLPPTAMLAHRARKRFLAEARALALLRHPNIVAIHEVIESDGFHAYAMEWVEGASLAEIIRKRAARLQRGSSEVDSDHAELPTANWMPFVCRVGIAIARALGEVHRAGLVHRDVKSSNILVRLDGTAMLSDFGLVRDAQSSLHTVTGSFLGTLSYAPPEQVNGEEVDERSDVYGLGVTLYEALALRLPFEGRTTAELARAIEAGMPASLGRVAREIPRDLAVIVAKAMDADPARRYATADELADDLTRLLALRPIRARPASLWTRGAKWVRRNRRSLSTSALVFVAVLIAALAVIADINERARIPGLVAEEVHAARLALLASRQGARAWIAMHDGGGARQPPVPDARVADALRAYERALELDPERADLRVEYSVVASVRALAGGAPPRAADLFELQRACPATGAMLGELGQGGELGAWTADGLAALAPADRRALGLVAYLGGDTRLAVEAWGALGTIGPGDPLVDGLVGQALLAVQLPASSYPRLLRAVDAFPESGSLLASAAMAAIACGDVGLGERFLEDARGARLAALPFELDVVAADLLWVRGHHAEAFRRYEELLGAHRLAGLRLTQFREAEGWFDRAIGMYLAALESLPADREVQQGLLRAADGWWRGFTEAERRDVLRRGLDGWLEDFGSIFRLLRGLEELAATNERARAGGPPPIFQIAIEPDALGPERDSTSILALAARLAVSRLDLRVCVELAPDAKQRLVAAWLDAAGGESWRADLATLEGAPGSASGPAAPWKVDERVLCRAQAGEESFGQRLVVLGDVDGDGRSDFAVSAPNASGASSHDGLVAIHSGSDGARIRTLTGATAFEYFGGPLAAAGDVNADGVPDLVTGTDGSMLEAPGYLLVVDAADGRTLLRLDSETDGNGFGQEVAGLGDVDGDGHDDLAVGATRSKERGESAGRVQVFSGRDGSELLAVHARGEFDYFGTSVVNHGDLDLDGVCDLAVGAPQFYYHQGGGYVVVHSGRTGAVLRTLEAPEGDLSFGASLANAGDLDEDGLPELAIGAYSAASNNNDPGAVYVVAGADGAILRTLAGAELCLGLTALGDVDGDALPDLAVLDGNPFSPRPSFQRIYSGTGRLLATWKSNGALAALPSDGEPGARLLGARLHDKAFADRSLAAVPGSVFMLRLVPR